MLTLPGHFAEPRLVLYYWQEIRELESLIGARPWTGHFGMTALLPAPGRWKGHCTMSVQVTVETMGCELGWGGDYHEMVKGRASNQVHLHFLELRGDKSGTGLGRPSFLA